MSLVSERARPQMQAVLDSPAMALDGFEVADGGDQEAGLDDVDVEVLECARRPQLLLEIHGSPRLCSPSRNVVSKMMT